MNSATADSKEIFSFHLTKSSYLTLPQFLWSPLHLQKIDGLKHSEIFFTMNLGVSVMSISRYHFNNFAFFAWWRDENALDKFLYQTPYRCFEEGWHIRMRLYRRWGEIKELKAATVDSSLLHRDKPVVAVTLARLKLLQIRRFIEWGKPVENQVRDHKGQTLALAAIRPLNTFTTFSIWKNESEMINMVHGENISNNGDSHKLAMQERSRKDFHHEFSTMRFVPFKEAGIWNGKSDFTAI